MTIPSPSPNYRTGKICYLEIPAIDIAESAQFYQQVFGWQIRQRNAAQPLSTTPPAK